MLKTAGEKGDWVCGERIIRFRRGSIGGCTDRCQKTLHHSSLLIYADFSLPLGNSDLSGSKTDAKKRRDTLQFRITRHRSGKPLCLINQPHSKRGMSDACFLVEQSVFTPLGGGKQ